MDRFFVGATLAGLSMLGVETAPMLNTTETIKYNTHFESATACAKQLDTIKSNHHIMHLTCVPNE